MSLRDSCSVSNLFVCDISPHVPLPARHLTSSSSWRYFHAADVWSRRFPTCSRCQLSDAMKIVGITSTTVLVGRPISSLWLDSWHKTDHSNTGLLSAVSLPKKSGNGTLRTGQASKHTNLKRMTWTMTRLLLLALICMTSVTSKSTDNVWRYFPWAHDEVNHAMKDTVLERRLEWVKVVIVVVTNVVCRFPQMLLFHYELFSFLSMLLLNL